MPRIGFIGLGNMGGPMAANLVKAGHTVKGYDLSEPLRKAAAETGVTECNSLADAVVDAEVVITMLPAGQHVRTVYLGEDGAGDDGILAHAPNEALLIDCSTIDVDTSRNVAAAAADKGLSMVEAPVSGGVGGAQAATLTFMVGGPPESVDRARPILEAMGRNVVHTGGPGTGQAAKMCNNMMLGIQMLSVVEAFALADRLGLDRQKLFDVASNASGQCWSLTTYCPVPGPVPASPANRDYQPGFTAAMMLKDLRLSQDAAARTGAVTSLGAQAAMLYSMFCNSGEGDTDFSGIFQMIDGQSR
ncbi:3-hydroxyisobutyrate dehydrogenase [Fodinicurvata sp. EGI_FJ10296]|uniref:3-hydroxyisobutyrate dehydrogenase n=1 Tax=Fodinicurvata sp. EGI_FJ10296 TaxID=3231908 RepID=UPI0034547066